MNTQNANRELVPPHDILDGRILRQSLEHGLPPVEERHALREWFEMMKAEVGRVVERVGEGMYAGSRGRSGLMLLVEEEGGVFLPPQCVLRLHRFQFAPLRAHQERLDRLSPTLRHRRRAERPFQRFLKAARSASIQIQLLPLDQQLQRARREVELVGKGFRE